MTASSRRKSAG